MKRTASLRARGALVVLVLMALSAGAGWAMSRASTPRSLSQPASLKSFSIRLFDFADPKPVTFSVGMRTPPDLTTWRSGVLTASSCRGGRRLSSGSVPFAVDGAPVMALYTPSPPFRDLSLGDRGSDVSSLQHGLSKVGLSVRTTGVFDSQTLRQINVMRMRHGLGAARYFERASMVWLPRAHVQVAVCKVALGQQVSSASPVASLRPEVRSIRFQSLPSPLAPGGRVLRLDGADLGGVKRGHESSRIRRRSPDCREQPRSRAPCRPTASVTSRRSSFSNDPSRRLRCPHPGSPDPAPRA